MCRYRHKKIVQSGPSAAFFGDSAFESPFIFNPYSGRNRRNPYLREQAAAFIKERGLNATVVSTERPRHATELARQAVDEGCGLVVAIGGDGTMNEVARRSWMRRPSSA